MDQRAAVSEAGALSLYYLCRMRKSIALLLLAAMAFSACSEQEGPRENQSVGRAQGTTYNIKYISESELNLKPQFDSIFSYIDQSMSTYQKGSLISKLNRGELIQPDPHFEKVLSVSRRIHGETNGAFDPTVGPLVKIWDFDGKDQQVPDSVTVVSALQRTGLDKLEERGGKLQLRNEGYLDFNAVAQGYTVDVLAEFLEERNIDRYMVEVGGELRCSGKNLKNEIWKIGVDKPQEEIDQKERFQFILKLKNAALATSGNYRKFWVDEETGERYAHTLDPKTGYPAKNRLLSASVIAPSCAEADAYATAVMVMGVESSLDFLQQRDDLQAYLVATDENGEWQVIQTDGFKNYLQE